MTEFYTQYPLEMFVLSVVAGLAYLYYIWKEMHKIPTGEKEVVTVLNWVAFFIGVLTFGSATAGLIVYSNGVEGDSIEVVILLFFYAMLFFIWSGMCMSTTTLRRGYHIAKKYGGEGIFVRRDRNKWDVIRVYETTEFGITYLNREILTWDIDTLETARDIAKSYCEGQKPRHIGVEKVC